MDDDFKITIKIWNCKLENLYTVNYRLLQGNFVKNPYFDAVYFVIIVSLVKFKLIIKNSELKHNKQLMAIKQS